MRTGPGATDNADKVILARGGLVPLPVEVARPSLMRLAGVLQSKLVFPVSSSNTKNNQKRARQRKGKTDTHA